MVNIASSSVAAPANTAAVEVWLRTLHVRAPLQRLQGWEPGSEV